MPRVLMIDDDARLAAMVRDYLQRAAMQVEVAHDAAGGLARLDAGVDLLILDLMLPDADGLDLCRRIRARRDGSAQVPILMLTARGDPLDRVLGLELGADDYLPKPFEPRELLARVRALLRRPRGTTAAALLRFGPLEIDPEGRRVSVDGQARALTSYQFDLLLALAERPGRVLTREQLMSRVARDAAAGFDPSIDRSIDVHIARIRAAIEADPKNPRHILTVRGAGYVFARSLD